jgi:hypothetical protein
MGRFQQSCCFWEEGRRRRRERGSGICEGAPKRAARRMRQAWQGSGPRRAAARASCCRVGVSRGCGHRGGGCKSPGGGRTPQRSPEREARAGGGWGGGCAPRQPGAAVAAAAKQRTMPRSARGLRVPAAAARRRRRRRGDEPPPWACPPRPPLLPLGAGQLARRAQARAPPSPARTFRVFGRVQNRSRMRPVNASSDSLGAGGGADAGRWAQCAAAGQAASATVWVGRRRGAAAACGARRGGRGAATAPRAGAAGAAAPAAAGVTPAGQHRAAAARRARPRALPRAASRRGAPAPGLPRPDSRPGAQELDEPGGPRVRGRAAAHGGPHGVWARAGAPLAVRRPCAGRKRPRNGAPPLLLAHGDARAGGVPAGADDRKRGRPRVWRPRGEERDA